MASQSSSELELPDCTSHSTGINFPKEVLRKVKIIYQNGNGYTIMLFQDIKERFHRGRGLFLLLAVLKVPNWESLSLKY